MSIDSTVTTGTHDPAETEATAELARFVAGLRLSALPASGTRRLCQCLLDFVGVAAGGRVHADSTRALLAGVVSLSSRNGTATVIGERRGFPARDAALLNGALAHSLDFDDTYLPALLHPGAAVIPAALALAELDDADGEALITAIAAGYEVCCRVGLALGGEAAYARGFHPTAIAGIFGAVAAAAHLRRCSEDEIASAFGLAGSMASGSMQYLETGSWNKRLHPGLAASNGLLALELSRAGVRGAARALEGRAGVLHGYSETPQPNALADGLGEHWRFGETGIKPYPACRLAHGAVDAALALRARLGGEVPAGARLTLRISPAAYTIVGGEGANKLVPQNDVDAQFSAYFQTAVALLDGKINWSSYERVGDAEVEELASRIELIADERVAPAGAVLACSSREGDLEEWVQQPVGEPDAALAWEDVESKFRALAGELLQADACEEIVAWIKGLPHARRVRELTRPLRAHGGRPRGASEV